ncbi:MAG: 7-cyano-7-deazaguanine synthase QueC [Planctomycetes bacterium GWF2_50_10]|nr:MAG: 7-cyano-7-deazaguanine synthase QueC [Planctomycetes bacterium GWF2_50_10]
MSANKAVVLLSGGLDSATTLAIARSQGYTCYCMSFLYGQRHGIELEAAKRVAVSMGAAEHRVIKIDLAQFGHSALTDESITVPKDRPELGMPSNTQQIPITYVPARNTIFLSYALAWSEVLSCFDIFIGVNAMDYSGYPDCRGEFITAFQEMANLATAAAVTGPRKYLIHTPIIEMTKAQIILKGTELGLDYGLTHSCYDPKDGLACGHCDSCQLRLKGFAEANLKDPVQYA